MKRSIPELTDTAKYRNVGSVEKMYVKYPRIVSPYNRYIGEVDIMNQHKVCYYM